MKRILKITAVYIGLVIGAGFASGREVMEYFNLYSCTSFFGIVISAFLFAVTANIILSKSAENNIEDYDGYISAVTGKLSPYVKGFMLLYMFCGLFVMFSGSGALVYDLSAMPALLGAVVMALICFVVLTLDLKGIVAVNIVLVPLMICGILYVCICSAIFKDTPSFSQEEFMTTQMALSAVCYASYNTITAGAVLVPLAKGAKRKEIRTASIISGFAIGLLILLVWAVQGMNFDVLWDSELPMLELAALCGKSCKRVYTAVLFMAIVTTAVSHGFGIMSHFSSKIKNIRQRALFSAVLCLVALPPAMYGFSNLVAQLYSFFGYVGMAWMVVIIADRYS